MISLIYFAIILFMHIKFQFWILGITLVLDCIMMIFYGDKI